MFDVFEVAATSLAASRRVLLARLRGVSADEQVDKAEVLFPHGFASRPSITATLFAVAARIGDEVLTLALRDKGSAAFSPTLQEGETRVFTIDGAYIKLLGVEIVLNGGTLKVARVTDPVRVGTLAGTAGPYPVNFTFVPHDADGAPGAPSVGASVTLAGVVSNAGGATNTKA